LLIAKMMGFRLVFHGGIFYPIPFAGGGVAKQSEANGLGKSFMRKRFVIATLCFLIFSAVAGFGQVPSSGSGGGQGTYGLGGEQSSSSSADCVLDPTDPSCSARSGQSGASQGNDGGSLTPRVPSIILDEASTSGFNRQSQHPSTTAQAVGAAQRGVAPTEFQNFVADSVGVILPIYGQKLFLSPATTFAPVEEVPVPVDYVIGPGDRLMIRVWGQVSIQVRTIVDRNGQIFIPKIGTLTVAGVKYAGLNDHLKREIGRVFRNFEISVSLAQLRTIEVFVLGSAKSPGRYTVSSLSTLINALFASGGPSASGSMRNIELKREGKAITNFDIYDLLVFGDKTKDVPLQSGDVIYIPPVGPEIAIAGSVNVPAIYEIKNEDLREAIRLAGGLTSMADGQQLSIERIENHTGRKVETLTLDARGLSTKLQDGDVIRATAILPRFDNAVTLRGNVANPGRFPWRKGMRISDLIPNKDVLLTRAFWNAQNQLIGGCEPVKPVDIPAAATYAQTPKEMQVARGKANQANQKYNEAQQPTQRQLQSKKAPSLQDLTQPCSRTIENEAELGADIRSASPEINFDYALIQRLNTVDLTTRLIPFNLGKVILQHDPSSDLELESGDIVMIFSQRDVRVPLQKQSKFVRVEGEVNAPGVYKIQPGDTLRTVIRRAGGVTPDAYLFATQLTRESVRQDQQRILQQTAATSGAQDEAQRLALEQVQNALATGRIVLPIQPSATSIDAYPEIVLEDGDKIVVSPQVKTVNVGGAVYNQSAYLYHSGMQVQDYVKLAGSGTRAADLKHLLVVRADGSILGPPGGGTFGFWKGNLNSTRVLPGDTIIIPSKIPGALLKNLQNWSQISGQLAITAAALAVVTGR
jgi:polysaccharide biosynthesis/export protein